MLAGKKLVAFVGVTNADHARAFYRELLGLNLIYEDDFALVFDVNGIMLRVTLVQEAVARPYTVLGWEVEDVTETVRSLADAGLRLERFAGLEQDEHGIWTAPGGARIAWFKDPDGNMLSVTQL